MAPNNLPRQRFSEASLQAIAKTVRTVLGTPTTQPEFDADEPPIPVGDRFRLRTPLEPGRRAIARRLHRIEVEGDPEECFQWIDTSEEVSVYGFGHQQNFLAAGAEVTCISTPHGWCVVDGGATIVLPPKAELEEVEIDKIEPFMVFPTSEFSSTFKYAWQCIVSSRYGLLSGVAYWGRPYYVIAGRPSLAPTGSTTPSAALRTASPSTELELQISPAVRLGTSTPVRCAYTPFDLVMSNGDPVPQPIIDHFGTNEKPGVNELWGPSLKGKLTRTFSALELFWWEIRTSDAYEARDYLTYVTQPEHPDHAAYLALFGGGGQATPLGPTPNERWPPVDISFWGNSDECGGLSSGVLASEPAPAVHSRFFIAPHGWWEAPEWRGYGYNWFYYNYRYNTPFGYYVPIEENGWFGPWGGWGHWGGYWGSAPPLSTDFVNTLTQPEQPPCGDIIKRYRYGFVLWEFGWAVVGRGLDEEAKTCVVLGPMQFKHDLVYDDVTTPDPTPFT